MAVTPAVGEPAVLTLLGIGIAIVRIRLRRSRRPPKEMIVRDTSVDEIVFRDDS